MLQNKKYDEETERLLNVILRNIQVGAYAPDNKLPSETQLLKLCSSDVYHIRKAISILKKEGILYSIPKFGVFIKKEVAQQPENIGNDAWGFVLFSTRNRLSEQRNLWNEIMQEYFTENSPGNFVAIYGESGKTLPKSDLYEYSHSCVDFANEKLLNIRKHFPEISAYPELMPDDFSIPLYYSTNLLIYNKDILKKLGFSAPEYGNFKEQQAFLAAITQETAKHKEYYLPGTAQSRRTALGNYLYEMKDDLFNGISRKSFREKYYDIIFRITDFWKDYPPPEPCYNSAISYDHFIAGKSPFFLCWSGDWIRITETKPDFQYGCAMMYTASDTICRIPMMLAIRNDTKYPVECLRLARFLQKPEIRKKSTQLGMLPLLDEEYKDLPFDLVISPEKKGKADFLHDDEYYICSSIINSEITNIVLRQKTIDDAISDIIMFSQGYLQMKQEDPS